MEGEEPPRAGPGGTAPCSPPPHLAQPKLKAANPVMGAVRSETKARRHSKAAIATSNKEMLVNHCKAVKTEGPWKKPKRRRGQEETGGPERPPQRPRQRYAARDKLQSSERKKLMKEGRCFACRQTGHRASDEVASPNGPKFVCPARDTEKPVLRKKPKKKTTP